MFADFGQALHRRSVERDWGFCRVTVWWDEWEPSVITDYKVEFRDGRVSEYRRPAASQAAA